MELIVRAVDVGSGNTKFVTAAAGPTSAASAFRRSPIRRATTRRRGRPVNEGKPLHPHRPAVLRGRARTSRLAADTFRAKQLHDEYTESPEYMALLRGALGMMKVSHIDLLVVGLPVALFAVKKAALEKAMTGSHDMGGGKTVTVGKALAVRAAAGRAGALRQPSTRRWPRSATSRA